MDIRQDEEREQQDGSRNLREPAAHQDKERNHSDDAITTLIRAYTREAGVRNLEREMEMFVARLPAG